MPDVDALLRRHAQLKQKRTLVEQPWRESYAYTYPLRGAKLMQQTGGSSIPHDEASLTSTAKAVTAAIYDTTATDGVRILASAIVAGTTPANSRWPAYGVAGYEEDDIPGEVKQYLDDGAELIWRNIHNANFDQVAFECAVDLCIPGLFAMFVDEDLEGGFTFEQWPLAQLWVGASKAGGPLDVVHREYWPTAEQAVNFYGETMVSPRVLKQSKDKPDERIGYLWVIEPRPGADGKLAQTMPYSSTHIELASKKLVRESGYHEMPLILPRWMVLPDSVYTQGPVWDALPTIKTLNKTVEFTLQNLDMAVAGMWGAVDDGVLNPRTVRVGPRKVIVMNDKNSFFPLSPAGKFELGELKIEQMQREVRRLLMADQLTPQDKPQMTATEVQVRVEIIRQLLGPVYGRMQSEYMKPLLERCFGIALRAGVLGQPPEWLLGKTLSVRYNSPLARAQKMVDVAAMDRFESTLAQEVAATGKTELLDNYDFDGAARERAELLGVPMKLIPAARKVEKMREERAAKQAEQQQQAMAAQAIGGQAIRT